MPHGGYADILTLLIPQNVALDIQDHDSNRYPIHEAAFGGYKRVVEILLQNGSDLDPVDAKGLAPLWLATHNGNLDVSHAHQLGA